MNPTIQIDVLTDKLFLGSDLVCTSAENKLHVYAKHVF